MRDGYQFRGAAARRRLDGLPASRSTSTCRWTSTRVAEGRQPPGHRHDDRPRRPDLPGRHGAATCERFFARESCGWCTPCREGLPWVAQHPARPSRRARASPDDLEILEQHVATAGAGPHVLRPGARAPMEPLESALKYFRDDFERHITREALSLEIDDADDLHRRQAVRGRGDGQNLLDACLSLGLRPALLLLAPGACARSAPAGSARSSCSRTRTTRRAGSSCPA